MLICVVGVPGSGKREIINGLTKKWDLHILPSATTRPMRKNEFSMHPYLFLREKEFKKLQNDNQFVETIEAQDGTMFGTLRGLYIGMVEENKTLIKSIDPAGLKFFKEQGFDVVSIFVKSNKTRPPKGIDYVVSNDNLANAVSECEKIIQNELKKRGRTLETNKKKDFIVVYNNLAGKGNGAVRARKIATELSKNGDVELVHSDSPESIGEYFEKRLPSAGAKTTVVVVGGDGTLGTTIDAIVKSKSKASVAVFPCGTANDFSRSINVNRKIADLVQLLLNGKPKYSDLALVNGEVHSVHAIGAGSFGHGSMEFSSVAKKRFGIFAYWLKCFKAAFSMRAQKLKVTIDGETIRDDFLFFYCTNGSVAGGFQYFAPHASISDGKFDFVGIKKCNIFTFSWVVARLLFGKHGTSSHVVMKSGRHIKVEALGPVNRKFRKSDVDGNVGPRLPLDIKVVQDKIKIYTEE